MIIKEKTGRDKKNYVEIIVKGFNQKIYCWDKEIIDQLNEFINSDYVADFLFETQEKNGKEFIKLVKIVKTK